MWRYVLLAMTAFALISCGDDPEPEPTPPATITAVSAPGFLLCNAESLYTFSVRIENLDALDSVVCLVTRPDGSSEIPFRLYDDAGSLPLSYPPYAGDNSGDVVANNGTYTRRIWSHLLCNGEEGEFTFQFQAVNGGEPLNSATFEVEIRAPLACSISNLTYSALYQPCIESNSLSLTITEDPNVRIDTVRVQWVSLDTVWWETDLNRTAVDSIWELVDVNPTLFKCTPTGSNYTMRIRAYNNFGLSCESEATGIAFENLMPRVLSSQLPDTIYRPVTPGDTDTLVFHAEWVDCELEGLAVTHAVFFDVRREDLSIWDHFPDFFLRDDGVAPDQHPGNDYASSYLLVPNNGRTNDLYYFRFYSIECSSGDTSEFWQDSTRLILPGGSPLIGGPSDDLGISFPK